MTKKVGVGVIGCGDIGELHARIYSEVPQANLVGVADIIESKAEYVAKKYGASTWCTDYTKLLKNEDLDLVSICTPEPLHREPAVAAAEAGKHILVEKPLATTLEDCDAIIKAAKKSGVILATGFENRFVPDFVKVKQYVQSGALGETLMSYARMNVSRNTARMVGSRVTKDKFGGEILEEGIHIIDTVLWWINDKVTKVYAECVAKLMVKENPNVEDIWLVTVRFKHGAVALIESMWIMPETWNPWSKPTEWLKWGCDFRFEIVGTDGAVYLDLFPTRLYAVDKEGWKFPFVWETYLPDLYGRIEGGLKMELAHLVECIAEGKRPMNATGEDGRAATQVALAAMKSAENGTPINVDSMF